ncbi:Rha family transcriptional regulator [Herminiimonas sp. CN]|uniref:Rha family transcriptional regulator n=1 Tax=Herminiimonas sp. CN TaxID=1349818 RepID=UPI000473ECFD|nr:Rha family transcriptional regulator [Herminiimonas sp. CN]
MQAITIVQQGIVHLSKGTPITDSLTIAREFGRAHKNVLQSVGALIEDGTISRLEFKPRNYTDERGKTQRMIELTERGALIAMPFIGGKKSRQGQVKLVDAFMAMRDALANQSAAWQDSRKAVSTSFCAMMDALQTTRADAGKATQQHHYANEAKLMNLVMFGFAGGMDKSPVSNADLKLLEKIEAKNAFLIARGRSYPERKVELQKHVTALRMKMLAKFGGAS